MLLLSSPKWEAVADIVAVVMVVVVVAVVAQFLFNKTFIDKCVYFFRCEVL